MGAVIDTLQLNRKIPLEQQIASKLNISHLHIINQNPAAIIMQVAKPGVASNMATPLQSSSVNKPYGKPKLGVTCKQAHAKERQRYILKKATVSAGMSDAMMTAFKKMATEHSEVQPRRSNNKLICRLAGFWKQSSNFICGSQTTANLIFEYFGDYTLHQQVKLRSQEILSKTMQLTNKNSSRDIRHQFSFKIAQIIRFTKFLLEVSQQMLDYRLLNGQEYFLCPKICLQDVIIIQKESEFPEHKKVNFKYRNPVDSINCCDRETIYSPVSAYSMGKQLTSHMLSNVGICTLGLCLLEDCYRSCFSPTGDICISVIEEKLHQIYRIYSQKNQEENVKSLCSLIQTLVFQNLADKPITLSTAKSSCNKLYLEIQRSILNIRPDHDTTKIMSSDLETSCTFNALNKKDSSSSKQHQMSLNENTYKQQHRSPYCSQSFPCIPQENPLKTMRNNKIRKCSKSSKLKNNGWSIQKSSQKKIQVNDSLAVKSREWVQKSRPLLKAVQCNEFLIKCEQIDNKWKLDDSMFQNMPEFEKLDSNIFDLLSERRPSQIYLNGNNFQNQPSKH